LLEFRAIHDIFHHLKYSLIFANSKLGYWRKGQ
jgi:hypothetical protein